MKGVPYEVTTVDQVRKDVAELAANKVDLVKIWVDDHLGRERKIPLDLAKNIIEEAHKKHLKVAAHVFYLDDAKVLVNAGLDALAHSVRDKPVDQALIDAMKKRGVYQLATLTRELSTFVFAQPGTMLDDPYLAPSVSGAMLRTLKSAEFQKQVAAEPDTEHGRAWSAVENPRPLRIAAARAGAEWASMSTSRVWISAIRCGSSAVSASPSSASRSRSAFSTTSIRLSGPSGASCARLPIRHRGGSRMCPASSGTSPRIA